MGLGKILFHSEAALVKVADLLFRLREILVGSFSVPIKGLFVIALNANGILVEAAEIVLRQRIVLLRCGMIVGQGALVIPRCAELMFIHVAQVILRRSETLISGFLEPEKSLSVVLGNADSAIKVGSEGELRLSVSCGSVLAKRVDVSVLRSRRGNQDERK